MNGVFYLLNIKINGIKNIEKEIAINFYKKNIDKNFSHEGYNVKAIYGENGSGKTAIVTAIDLLKNLVVEQDYLTDNSNQKYLDEIINKKIQEFSCVCEFLVKNEKLQVFKYAVTLKKNLSDKYVIVYESLETRARTGKNYNCIFEINNGELTTINCNKDNEEIIKSKTANLLDKVTFVANSYSLRSVMIDDPTINCSMIMLLFGLSTYCYLDKTDKHDMYFLSKTLKELEKDDAQIGKLVASVIFNIDKFTGVRDKRVHKDDFEKYQRKVKQLEAFLKLYKPNLEKIIIDRKENRDYYECSLILNYGSYSVDKEFESTGIKRLIDLFDFLNYAAEGDIVFIDEMDANINDIYLCKLVEFFMEYGEGQLCFTTHNTSPMKSLKTNKNSIDFLSNDNRIIPWKTNGNYAPESLYRAGMIQYLPFNIESTDFVGILGGEND